MNESRTKSLKRIALWGKILGITGMIFGGLYGFFGLFAFIVGAIPGLIIFVMGYFVYLSGKSAKNLLAYIEVKESEEHDGYEQEVNILLDNYGKILLLNGVLLVIGVVIYLLLFIFLGIYGLEILEGL